MNLNIVKISLGKLGLNIETGIVNDKNSIYNELIN